MNRSTSRVVAVECEGGSAAHLTVVLVCGGIEEDGSAPTYQMDPPQVDDSKRGDPSSTLSPYIPVDPHLA